MKADVSENEVAKQIVDAAFHVHTSLGPGLLESVYEVTAPVHKKQLLTHLRVADKRLGLLINFNFALIKDGITRIANGMPD